MKTHVILCGIGVALFVCLSGCGKQEEHAAPAEADKSVGEQPESRGEEQTSRGEPPKPPGLGWSFDLDLGAGVKMQFVRIPAGAFTMGSDNGKKDEKPVHKVTISKPFYMGRCEVTQEQWQAVMGENPSRFKTKANPVESVSWEDCQAFLNKVNAKLSGMAASLPTEAEWEFACRAGSTAKYCFGDDETTLPDYAWHSSNSRGNAHPVGQKKSNAWGLHDMHGNVWEWCQDWYADSYPAGEQTDPTGPSSGTSRVLRGGSWYHAATFCRSASRYGDPPTSRYPVSGFRVVLRPGEAPRTVAEKPPPPATQRQRDSAKALSVPVQKAVDLGGGVTMQFVFIPAGTFLMGSDKGGDNEKPVHKVTITKPFYMGTCEVTQEQWQAVMPSNPSRFKGKTNPVEHVSWNECQAFLNKVNAKLSGMTACLPTEAEWEYACRAGSTTKYCCGDDAWRLGDYAWHRGNSEKTTHPAGRKKANAWGLHDMHGNVWEWCQDWYADVYPAGDQTDPTGPASGTSRVLRGGSRINFAPICRSAYHNGHWPNIRYHNGELGFRVVLRIGEERPTVSEKPTPTQRQKDSAKALGVPVQTAIDLGGGVKMQLVHIPAGTFLMGSDKGSDNEKPVHKVTISKPFYMGKHEVTQEQWQAVMGANPSRFTGKTNPVGRVSWNDCQAFLKKLNAKLSGMAARLPTEAEWEYACRAGPTTKYCFGEDEKTLADYAWYSRNSRANAHGVGQKRANAWGLHDMHGNVWEWCRDWYADVYPGGEQTDPTGPSSGRSRVLRGGSWSGGAAYCRSALRLKRPPFYPGSDLGFRVVLRPGDERPTVPEKPPSSPTQEQKDAATKLNGPVERAVDLGGGVTMQFVVIPSGTFFMGSDKGENGEKPVHRVTITEPFYMGKHEVTQEQWQAVMGANPSRFKARTNPVGRVSWEDCRAFLKKLNTKLSGMTARLPTEAEWEYACRAGSTTEYCFGDDEKTLADYAWCRDNSGWKTHPVGQKKSNPWDLHDMHGNVAEWCHDRHGPYPPARQTDPTGPTTGGDCVLRGGSCYSSPSNCRAPRRAAKPPSNRYSDLGFRVVLRPGRGIPDVSKIPQYQVTQWQNRAAKELGVPLEKAVDLGGDVKMELVFIPAGTFLMGSDKGEDREKPVHKVTITQPFYMGKHEVTQEQWQAVMGRNPSRFKGKTNPVERVSWNDCQAFLKKLSARLPGIACRLPAEAEWEHACRAGSSTEYWFGADKKTLGDYGWYLRNSGNKTHPVGGKRPNAWGLYGMHGNVWEWCQDWYGPYPPRGSRDPAGPRSGKHRVIRGGSWFYNAAHCRSARRGNADPAYRYIAGGFRVVLPASVD